MTLSFSAFKVFEQCPLRFKFEYIDHLDKVKIEYPATRRGKEFHAMMEDIFKALKDEVYSYSYEDLVDYYALGRELPDYLVDGAKDYLVKVAIETAVKYDGKAEEKIAIKIVDNEFIRTDFEDPDAVFRGIIDLWWVQGKEIHILDWKTGEVLEPDPDQLSFYVMLIKNAYPELKDHTAVVEFVFVNSHGVDSYVSGVENDIEKLNHYWLERLEKIKQTKTFEPRGGTWCAFCPVAHHCPIADKVSTRDPKSLALRYLVLKSALENTKILLEEILKEAGEIELDDGIMMLRKTPYRKVNSKRAKERIVEALSEGRITLEDILDSVNYTAKNLAKLGIDDEDLFTTSYRTQIWTEKK